MRIALARVVPFAIPFRAPIRAGAVLLRERRGCRLELYDHEGRVGVGEAAPSPGRNDARIESLENDLRTTCDALMAGDAAFESLLARAAVARLHATKAAVECALYDLAATERGVLLADLLGAVRRTKVPVNALIAVDSVHAATAAMESGFTCLKVKISQRDMEKGAVRLREIRDAVGAEMKIRIDLNRAWTVEEALRWIPELAPFGLEYVEQPVTSIDELARVRAAVGVPIAADECVTGAAAVRAIAQAGAADVIVVKPTIVGLTEARRIVQAAAECRLDVVVTSTLDTSIGIAAALHLAATLPDPIRHCGLATATLLGGDLVREPLIPERGLLGLPDAPGLGLVVDHVESERWRAHATDMAAAG